mmetsp:Transcript_6388/g.11112  ORF Transcript_6388/g.11112 Transcript_6388/m.11112 type:complete len:82 (+) Transcript_6388:107-352(+)
MKQQKHKVPPCLASPMIERSFDEGQHCSEYCIMKSVTKGSLKALMILSIGMIALHLHRQPGLILIEPYWMEGHYAAEKVSS